MEPGTADVLRRLEASARRVRPNRSEALLPTREGDCSHGRDGEREVDRARPRPASDRHRDRCRLAKGALGRTHHERPCDPVPGLRCRRQAAAAGSRHRGVDSARIPCERRLRPGSRPARLRRHVCDSTHLHTGSYLADRLSRRRHCHPCAGRQSALHPHPVSHLRRRSDLGRALSARRPSARHHSAARSRLTPSEDNFMEKVISKDGTSIAFERSGAGPAVILVDGALCSRAFGPMPKLAPLLARQFTVFMYDRRGRGDSGDTRPYAKEREVEDIEALIQAAGGSAFVLGLSSGAALALEAAARGLGITAPFVLLMRLMVGVWRKLEAVAHTLPYDAAVMGDFSLPVARLASIATPTLAIHGGKTDARLQKAVRAVAKAVPGAQLRTLKGQTHNVKPEVLSTAVVEFFAADHALRSDLEARRCGS